MRLRGWAIGFLATGVALCALVAAGCGGGSDATPPSPAEAHVLAEGGILATQPVIGPGKGFPPKKLVIRDINEGTGVEAKKGDEVQIQYLGVNWRDGSEHSNSWRYEHIPTFTLGQHRLLRGLNMGIPGMKEGGSREIIIPYNLVYYPNLHHRALGPLDALIFKVYLVKVSKNHS
jgi:peptidylprolyl isomerase